MNSPKANIVLGVSGGIAAYKACDLVRELRKQNYSVRVVMSKNAAKFVSALTFATLSEHPVIESLFSEASHDYSSTAHIDLAQWGDLFLVAPATANFLAKLANGICDDALSTESISFSQQIVVAPAMNTRMWEAASTQANVELLKERAVAFVGPVSGELACGEVGLGKMSEVEAIVAFVKQIFQQQQILAGKKILITSGPTRSYIDSLRFISNRSSGKMGYALAKAAQSMGAKVVLVSGPVDREYSVIPGVQLQKVETNQEMTEAAEANLADSDIVIAAAAVSDFQSETVGVGKIERMGNLQLNFTASEDIIARLAKQKRQGQVFVGFAAQTGNADQEHQRAKEKLRKKKLDLIAMNDVSRMDIGFDSNENEMHIYQSVKNKLNYSLIQKNSKSQVAARILTMAMEVWKNENSLND